MNQTVATGTLPETGSAAGTVETGEETMAEIEAEIEEATDHGRATDATSSRTAQCRRTNTDASVEETEVEAAGTVGEDETEVGERALGDRTIRVIAMDTTEMDDQQNTTTTAAAHHPPPTPPFPPVPIQKAHASPSRA